MDPSKPGPSKRKDSPWDPRTWEFIMAAVESLDDDDKLAVVEAKYKGILKQLQELEAEVPALRIEQKKAEMLENLARGLQKQNKEIMDEASQRLKNEEQKRQEATSNFTEKLDALTALMDENKEKSVRLREENLNMAAKFKELYAQFQERGAHLANVNCQLELQQKLSDTQQKKLEVEFQTEREIWQKERLLLAANLRHSEETNEVLQENIKSLQEHLDSYQKQYTDFETTMKKSNKVFDNFKEELARIHKSNSTMEKDRDEWHSRWQIATQTINEITEHHAETTKDLIYAQRKIEMLEKLCRQLQTDRFAYIQQLKEHNIEAFTTVNSDLENELKNVEGKLNLPQQDDVRRKVKEKKVSFIEPSDTTLDNISSASIQQVDSVEPCEPGLRLGDAHHSTDRTIELHEAMGTLDLHDVFIHNAADGPSHAGAGTSRGTRPPNLENGETRRRR